MRRAIRKKMQNSREYRVAFTAAHVISWVALQIRVLREQRGWSQADLAERLGTRQSAISRLENEGGITLDTLIRLSDIFDVALVAKFVDHKRFSEEFDNLSIEAMQVDGWPS